MALPVDLRLLTRALWWTRAVCYVLAGLATLVLLGWLLRLELLTALLHPSRTAMNPLTAIGFILAAWPLISWVRSRGRKPERGTARRRS